MVTILFVLLSALFSSSHASTNKRGLIYIPNKKYPGDDSIWERPGSDLTWYYNYGASPTSEYSNSNLQFVPMLWGTPSSSGSFYNTVKSLKDGGMNITHVLGFNEPDGTSSQGGSNIAPDKAAALWIKEIEPLKSLGIKLGAPACQGSPSGTNWLSSFIYNCNGNCTIDFIPVHWYGNFEGFASHVGQIYASFGNKTIWATEFALSGASLANSQTFYNQSSSFLDQL
jgi:Glycosyl hydrolase catalytic core